MSIPHILFRKYPAKKINKSKTNRWQDSISRGECKQHFYLLIQKIIEFDGNLPVHTTLGHRNIYCAYLCHEIFYIHNPFFTFEWIFWMNHNFIIIIHVDVFVLVCNELCSEIVLLKCIAACLILLFSCLFCFCCDTFF